MVTVQESVSANTVHSQSGSNSKINMLVQVANIANKTVQASSGRILYVCLFVLDSRSCLQCNSVVIPI